MKRSSGHNLPADRGPAALFELIFHNTQGFIGLLDPHGLLIEVNRPVLALLGLRREEVVGRPAWELPAWTPGARADVEAAVKRAARGAFVRFETEIVVGRRAVVDLSVRPVPGAGGEVAFLMAEGRDVTAERETQTRFQTVMEALHEGVVLQTQEGRVTALNRAAERILGLSHRQLVGRSALDPSWRTVHEDGSPYPSETHPAMLALRTGEAQREQIMGVYRPDGSLTWIMINAEPLRRAAEGPPYAVVSSFTDITTLKEAAARLEWAARHDPLTGLPTRRLFEERLGHALAHAERHPGLCPALLFIDLDNFKGVNDAFGHGAGDALLVRVGELLRGAVREGDTVARLGGDEFAVLLEGPNTPGNLTRLTERVAELLTLSVPGPPPRTVTASVGAAVAESGLSARDLLVRADTAMYGVKRRARGRGGAFGPADAPPNAPLEASG